MTIPSIKINEVGVREIPQVYTPEWLRNMPTTLPNLHPITQQIGSPIINIPGCVTYHKEQSTTGKMQDELRKNDKDGNMVLCDSGVPSFSPIDYDASRIQYKYEPPVPVYQPPPEAELPGPPPVPDTSGVTKEEEQQCPTEIQEAKEPVGTVTGDQKIVEYKLIKNGTQIECVPIKVKVSIPDQVVGNIPTAGAIMATTSIAVVATTSALLAKPLAELLLKVVKPAVKKVMSKINSKGSHPRHLSLSERRTDRYRSKRGLPPLKRKLD
jgi:hypothetical protein